MPKFRFIPEIAIADVAFEAEGKDINELFVNCALATEESMVNTKKVKPKVSKTIKLEADALDRLMIDWLNEVIYYKDAEGLLFCEFIVKVLQKGKNWTLEATAKGEKRDPKKHELRADVKAATWHLFELKQEKGKWKARIVEDI
ncbi:MAG: archease [Candidatus Aenigmatarchaeota archaeon]